VAGEVCGMNLVQNMRSVSGGTDITGVVHLLLTEGEVKMMAENPEKVIEQIRVRAEQVSSVLEGILLEPHGQPRWGLNE
jgi:hypothetical protein